MTVNLNIKVGNTTLNVPARVASQQQKSLIGKMKSAANVLKGSNEMQIKASDGQVYSVRKDHLDDAFSLALVKECSFQKKDVDHIKSQLRYESSKEETPHTESSEESPLLNIQERETPKFKITINALKEMKVEHQQHSYTQPQPVHEPVPMSVKQKPLTSPLSDWVVPQSIENMQSTDSRNKMLNDRFGPLLDRKDVSNLADYEKKFLNLLIAELDKFNASEGEAEFPAPALYVLAQKAAEMRDQLK